MTTFFAIVGVLVAWTLITTAALAALAWWGNRHTPAPTTAGAWWFECDCGPCRKAVQPSMTICPSGRSWGHIVPRDQFAHDITGGDCVCSPEESLTLSGPMYLHRPLSEVTA